MTVERLQKVLSQAGLGSRREMERWIESGMIKVNGETAHLGMSVSEKDRLIVRGKLIDNPLKRDLRTRFLLYHKPVGEISSTFDPKHKKTIFDHLPKIRNGRWIQIGRLDINTSGLMVFTNNGEVANKMMHPSYVVEREYAVRVRGEVTQDMMKALLAGVQLDDGIAKFNSIDFRGGEGSNAWYHVVLTEGRNREVRRLWQSQGLDVARLTRVRFGAFYLPRSLPRGACVELEADEVEQVLKLLPQ